MHSHLVANLSQILKENIRVEVGRNTRSLLKVGSNNYRRLSLNPYSIQKHANFITNKSTYFCKQKRFYRKNYFRSFSWKQLIDWYVNSRLHLTGMLIPLCSVFSSCTNAEWRIMGLEMSVKTLYGNLCMRVWKQLIKIISCFVLPINDSQVVVYSCLSFFGGLGGWGGVANLIII